MSDPRKAHVTRIQNNHSGLGQPLADGTPPDQVASDDSIWLDVLRLDEIRLLNPNANQGENQTFRFVLKWQDKSDDHPNTRRKLHDGHDHKSERRLAMDQGGHHREDVDHPAACE